MTDNEKLARFQGWGHIVGIGWCSPNADDSMHEYLDCPDYLNDDAAAMSLLDTLVEKEFYPLFEYQLFNGTEQWTLQLWIKEKHGSCWESFFVCEAVGTTRRAVVVAAVLEMIEKEDV